MDWCTSDHHDIFPISSCQYPCGSPGHPDHSFYRSCHCYNWNVTKFICDNSGSSLCDLWVASRNRVLTHLQPITCDSWALLQAPPRSSQWTCFLWQCSVHNSFAIDVEGNIKRHRSAELHASVSWNAVYSTYWIIVMETFISDEAHRTGTLPLHGEYVQKYVWLLPMD